MYIYLYSLDFLGSSNSNGCNAHTPQWDVSHHRRNLTRFWGFSSSALVDVLIDCWWGQVRTFLSFLTTTTGQDGRAQKCVCDNKQALPRIAGKCGEVGLPLWLLTHRPQICPCHMRTSESMVIQWNTSDMNT